MLSRLFACDNLPICSPTPLIFPPFSAQPHPLRVLRPKHRARSFPVFPYAAFTFNISIPICGRASVRFGSLWFWFASVFLPAFLLAFLCMISSLTGRSCDRPTPLWTRLPSAFPLFSLHFALFSFVFPLFLGGGKTKVNCLTLNYGKRWTPGKGVGKIEFPGLASPAASIS